MSTTISQKNIYTKCCNPCIIYNKTATYLLAKHHTLIAQGKEIHISSMEIDKLNNGTQLPAYFKYIAQQIKINNDLILDYYVPTLDGQICPLFYFVPCRRCPFCCRARSRDMQTRAMCENMTSDTPPISVLLTYNPENLPKNGVSKEDIDYFLKRLRIGLVRDGHTLPLRFLLVSEYGSKKGRAHYHVIFWNFPQFSNNKYLNYQQVKTYLEKYWQKGFCSVRFSHDGSNKNSTSHATSYFVKYVYKGSNTPKGKNKPFIKSSRRPGLGSAWLSLNEEFYLKNTYCKEIIIRDKWSNNTYKSTFPRYFHDKLFPSVSKLVPKLIRDCYKLFNRCSHLVDDETRQFIQDKYWFLPTYNVPLIDPKYFKSYYTNQTIFKLIPHQNELHFTKFSNLQDLIDYLCLELQLYELTPLLTDYLFQLKYDFASEYFDILDKSKIPLENMTPLEYYSYQANLLKPQEPHLSDEQ